MVCILRKRKTARAERPTARERLADSADVSKELILDVPKLVFIGSREVAIENCRGITEYTENKIVVEAKAYKLCLEGTQLEVKTITEDMLCVFGKIKKLEFVGEVG